MLPILISTTTLVTRTLFCSSRWQASPPSEAVGRQGMAAVRDRPAPRLATLASLGPLALRRLQGFVRRVKDGRVPNRPALHALRGGQYSSPPRRSHVRSPPSGSQATGPMSWRMTFSGGSNFHFGRDEYRGRIPMARVVR